MTTLSQTLAALPVSIVVHGDGETFEGADERIVMITEQMRDDIVAALGGSGNA